MWDIINHTEPWTVWEKKTNLGALLCLASNPDNPFVFAVGGDHKSHNFKVFDFQEISEGMFVYRSISNINNFIRIFFFNST